MRRILSSIALVTVLATPATTVALSSYSGGSRSYSSPSYSRSYSSSSSARSSSSSSRSSSSSSRSSGTSSSRSSSIKSTPSTTYKGTSSFNGRTYNYSEPYYNNTGLWVFFWVYVAATANQPAHYQCFDEDHKEISCNRSQAKTSEHNGATYYISSAYKNTKDQTVAYYQKFLNKQEKTYYVCYDAKYVKIACDRKSS